MHFVTSRWFVGGLAVASILRAAVACDAGSDDGASVPAAEAGTEPAESGTPSSTSDATVVPGTDAGSQPDVAIDSAPPGPPSFCTGIVLYATFDNGAAPELGNVITREVGGVGASAGQFGGARSFQPDASIEGAAVFFDRADGGPSVYPRAEGSIAFWYRRAQWTYYGTFVRPLSRIQPATTGGLLFGREGDELGLWRDQLGSDPIVVVSETESAPFRRETGFNHYVEAWRVDVDAGKGSLAVMAINGGVGEVFGDSGVDAAGYLAQTPDDAGNLLVPFRGQTTTAWAAHDEAVSLRVGGTRFTAAEGAIDDFAVWDRVLSTSEIAELYKRGQSIGVACKLQ